MVRTNAGSDPSYREEIAVTPSVPTSLCHCRAPARGFHRAVQRRSSLYAIRGKKREKEKNSVWVKCLKINLEREPFFMLVKESFVNKVSPHL